MTEAIHKERYAVLPPPDDFVPSEPPREIPKRRRRPVYIRPAYSLPPEDDRPARYQEEVSEAEEIADLADDSFFFAQLKKNNRKRKLKKKIPIDEREVDKDIEFYHGDNKNQQLKAYRDEIDEIESDDDVYYDDSDDDSSGSVESEKADIELIDDEYEEIKVKPKRRRRPKQKPKQLTKSMIYEQQTTYRSPPYIVRDQIRPKSVHKRKKTVVEMKKFHQPEQLLVEIGKILDVKSRNYEKQGHDKTHWELRIVPRRYENYEPKTGYFKSHWSVQLW